MTRYVLFASLIVGVGPWAATADQTAPQTPSTPVAVATPCTTERTPDRDTRTGQDAAADDKTKADNKIESDKARKTGDDTSSSDAALPATPADGNGNGNDPEAAGAKATQDTQRDDAVLDRAQPDFTVITLPTTLRLPKYRSAFRVTHRFARPLAQGDFGDLLEDFFGFDAGALIGLEFRFGLLPGTQIGINRTSDKTIQFFGQYDIVSQSDAFPLGLAAFGSIDGTNNFRDSYSPGVGLVVSRKLGDWGALYVEPFWVNNTNELPSELADDNDTFFIGVGSRVRVRPTVYLVGEWIPRVAGFDPGVHGGNFGIEKRVGGHSFQLNFSNFLGTTLGQVARGGGSNDDWYIGFNITRKFF